MIYYSKLEQPCLQMAAKSEKTVADRINNRQPSEPTVQVTKTSKRLRTKMKRCGKLPPPDPLFTFRGHTGKVTAISFCGGHLVSGSDCGEIFIWDLHTKRLITKWLSHDGKPILWIGSIDTMIITQGRNGFVNLWVENSPRTLHVHLGSLPCSEASFCPCDILVEGSLLAVPSKHDSHISIFNIKTKEEITKIGASDNHNLKYGSVLCCKLCKLPSDGRKIALLCGYEDGSIILWNIKNSCIIAHLKLFSNEAVLCLTIGKHNETLQGVAGSVENRIGVFKLTENEELELSKIMMICNPGVSAVVLRRDEKLVCFGGWDNRLRVYSWKSMKSLAVLKFHTDTIRCLRFCDQTKLLAAGSDDCTISIWAVYN